MVNELYLPQWIIRESLRKQYHTNIRQTYSYVYVGRYMLASRRTFDLFSGKYFGHFV